MVAFFYAALLLSAPAHTASFCERLAETIQMQTVESEADGRSWRKNMLRLKDYLIGGTEATVMKIDIGDNPSLADFKRIQGSCGAEKKGDAFCKINGPETFILSMHGQETSIKAEEGESAEVKTSSHYLTCRDGTAMP